MADFLYILGVFLAILSGSLNNIGSVFQKKVVNEIPPEAKFFRSLVKKPLWIIGLILQMVVGSVFFLIAQIYIGPALIPGLMAFGLIFLAIGSVKIVGETLNKVEIMGILLMILGIFLLGMSELSIDITVIDILAFDLVLNIIIFTILLFLGSIICEILQRKIEKLKGILLAISSGFQFSLTNFWIAPLMAVIAHVFEGTANFGELFLFIASAVILIIANIIGTMEIQQCFQVANASRMIPIQQVPIQITPVIAYFFVFTLMPSTFFPIIYVIISVSLIILSSFLLAKRQQKLEAIK
jgi:drug/metabolite transporter (DMT)-like permease